MALNRLRNLSFLALLLVYLGGERAQLGAQGGCPTGSTCYECQVGSVTTTCTDTPAGGDNYGTGAAAGCSNFTNWNSWRSVQSATCFDQCVEQGGHDDYIFSFTSWQSTVDTCSASCACTDEGGGGPPEM
jgi:hypothetical protein